MCWCYCSILGWRRHHSTVVRWMMQTLPAVFTWRYYPPFLSLHLVFSLCNFCCLQHFSLAHFHSTCCTTAHLLLAGHVVGRRRRHHCHRGTNYNIATSKFVLYIFISISILVWLFPFRCSSTHFCSSSFFSIHNILCSLFYCLYLRCAAVSVYSHSQSARLYDVRTRILVFTLSLRKAI